MEKLIIKNCKLLNGKKTDVAIQNGKISKIGTLSGDTGTVIDGNGKTLLPAFVDMHVHLREPGLEYKEDIESGAKAAVRGGFAAVACMPNTLPVCDTAAVVRYIRERSNEVSLAEVYPIGAISKEEKGEELAEIGKMKEAGAVAVSDDGRPVSSANLMRHAMEYASDFDIPVLSHCEEKTLSEGGCVNEGFYSMLTGLKGISRASEEINVAREIILAETFGKRIHLCHISTEGSVRLVREAKKRGVKVTAETCPHYFTIDDSAVENFDTNAKVNPPLRETRDVEAVIVGLKDGTIDAIATDHAPHHRDEKEVEFLSAAFGISGLETSFSLAYTQLVLKNFITLEKLCALMTKNPANILNIPYGEITTGARADLVLVDLDKKYIIDPKSFFSKGKNTPFAGREVYGEVYCTIVKGEVKYLDGKINGSGRRNG